MSIFKIIFLFTSLAAICCFAKDEVKPQDFIITGCKKVEESYIVCEEGTYRFIGASNVLGSDGEILGECTDLIGDCSDEDGKTIFQSNRNRFKDTSPHSEPRHRGRGQGEAR